MSEENRIELSSLEYVMVSAEPETVQEFIEHIKATSPYGPKDVLVRAGDKEYHMKYKWPEGYSVAEMEPIPVEIKADPETDPENNENSENKPADPDPVKTGDHPIVESIPPVVSEPETIAPVIPENQQAEPDSK